MNDRTFKRFVINYYGNLPKILKEMGIESGRGGLMFCPMHDNYNTPAAKLFKDKTGWHFYCFTENRQFGTYDVYQQVYGYNMDQVFDHLWNQLSESDRTQMYDIFGEFDDSSVIENIEIYQKFKYAQITYSQLKDFLCQKVSQE